MTQDTHAGEKFKPPKNPLEMEKALKFIVPKDEDKKRLSRQFIETQIRMLREDAEDLASTDQGWASIQAELTAWSFWKSLQRLEEENIQNDKDFMLDFWAWLQGKGQQSDHDVTPWGRIPPKHPSVIAYLDSFISKKFEYVQELMHLFHFGPSNLDEFYLYFKFIIRGRNNAWTEDAFLHEWGEFMQNKRIRGANNDDWTDDHEANLLRELTGNHRDSGTSRRLMTGRDEAGAELWPTGPGNGDPHEARLLSGVASTMEYENNPDISDERRAELIAEGRTRNDWQTQRDRDAVFGRIATSEALDEINALRPHSLDPEMEAAATDLGNADADAELEAERQFVETEADVEKQIEATASAKELLTENENKKIQETIKIAQGELKNLTKELTGLKGEIGNVTSNVKATLMNLAPIQKTGLETSKATLQEFQSFNADSNVTGFQIPASAMTNIGQFGEGIFNVEQKISTTLDTFITDEVASKAHANSLAKAISNIKAAKRMIERQKFDSSLLTGDGKDLDEEDQSPDQMNAFKRKKKEVLDELSAKEKEAKQLSVNVAGMGNEFNNMVGRVNSAQLLKDQLNAVGLMHEKSLDAQTDLAVNAGKMAQLKMDMQANVQSMANIRGDLENKMLRLNEAKSDRPPNAAMVKFLLDEITQDINEWKAFRSSSLKQTALFEQTKTELETHAESSTNEVKRMRGNIELLKKTAANFRFKKTGQKKLSQVQIDDALAVYEQNVEVWESLQGGIQTAINDLPNLQALSTQASLVSEIEGMKRIIKNLQPPSSKLDKRTVRRQALRRLKRKETKKSQRFFQEEPAGAAPDEPVEPDEPDGSDEPVETDQPEGEGDGDGDGDGEGDGEGDGPQDPFEGPVAKLKREKEIEEARLKEEEDRARIAAEKEREEAQLDALEELQKRREKTPRRTPIPSPVPIPKKRTPRAPRSAIGKRNTRGNPASPTFRSLF